MLTSINIHSSVSVYEQIENQVKFAIASGQLKATDQLPLYQGIGRPAWHQLQHCCKSVSRPRSDGVDLYPPRNGLFHSAGYSRQVQTGLPSAHCEARTRSCAGSESGRTPEKIPGRCRIQKFFGGCGTLRRHPQRTLGFREEEFVEGSHIFRVPV